MLRNQAFIERYFSEMAEIIPAISRPDVDRVIELLFSAWQRGATVFVMGNGGSASTATHFACDLQKCTIVNTKRRFKALALNDNIPLASAWINDNGFENLFSEQLKNFLQSGDVVVALSVHGGVGQDRAGLWSQNLLKAVHLAKERGAVTIGLSGFNGGALKELADACIVVPFNSTPQVESFHAVLEHLVTFCLRERIQAFNEGGDHE